MNKLNITNKLLTIYDIQNILREGNISTKIKSVYHYQRAFTHKSYIKSKNDSISFDKRIVPLQKYSNERYEFGGDSIISQTVCLYLLKRYPQKDEGFLTNVKIRLVERNALAYYAKKLNFSKWILISKYMETIHGRFKDKILEDVYESFIYAIYLDLGLKIAEKFIVSIIEKYTDFASIIHTDINYKHQLLKKFHKYEWEPPTYEKENEIGPIHSKTFTVSVSDPYGFKLGFGVAKTKKQAEQCASLEALNKLKKIDEYLSKLTFEKTNELKMKINLCRLNINDNCCISYLVGGIEKEKKFKLKKDKIDLNYVLIQECLLNSIHV